MDTSLPDISEHAARDQALFDRIAQSYCRKDLLPAQALARRHRLEQTLAHIPLGSDMRLLEVGCGAGFAAAYLRGRYASYRGIDYAHGLIEYARHYNGSEVASFEEVDVDAFQASEPFDVVIMIGVLHHLADMSGSLRRVAGLVRPGGWVIANEPQPANPVINLARWVRKKADSAYSADQRELSSRELEDLFASAGLVDIRIVPQGILSTPFAEVAMPAQRVARPLSAVACSVDRAIEDRAPSLLGRLSWNLVAAGRRPTGPQQ